MSAPDAGHAAAGISGKGGFAARVAFYREMSDEEFEGLRSTALERLNLPLLTPEGEVVSGLHESGDLQRSPESCSCGELPFFRGPCEHARCPYCCPEPLCDALVKDLTPEDSREGVGE